MKVLKVQLSAETREGLERLGIDPDSIGRPFLRPSEVTALTSVSESTLSEWRQAGRELAFVQEGKTVLYPVASVVEWLHKRLRAAEALPAGVMRAKTELDLLLPPSKLRYLIDFLNDLQRAFAKA